MNDTSQKHPNALKRVVYEVSGMATARVQHDVEYHRTADHSLTFDLHRADPHESSSPLPVVLFVAGFPDVGVRTPLGCCFKEVEMIVSLAQLVAAAGMAAVAYTSRRPTDDIQTVLDYLAGHAAELNIDVSRVGLWACSAHGPLALSALMRQPGRFRAAVLSNVYTLDIEGTAVADAATQWGFAAVEPGRSVEELPRTVPLFIVRSGQDEMPDLNRSLDRFVGAALAHNLPATVVNHPGAPHAFEMNHDSDDSRAIIQQMLAFLQTRLS